MTMKRSEINQSIDKALAFFDRRSFPLPAWARWSPEEWAWAGPEYDEVRALRLGWDVTDFESGDLANIGRTIFTLRNGAAGHVRTYAEKAMCLFPEQRSVIHCHRSKCEDIICRSGGHVCIELWNAAPDGRLSETAVTVQVDGQRMVVDAGKTLRLNPGMSICIPPMLYHRFWGEGDQPVLSIEVSSVCDDLSDNIFADGGERFPAIEEDEPRRWILCLEYDSHKGTNTCA